MSLNKVFGLLFTLNIVVCYTRPTGTVYVRYEDLYKSGMTFSSWCLHFQRFGLNIYWGGDHRLTRVEADGRRSNGVRYGSSPFGWNSVTGGVVTDCYGHHAIAGMPTFWQTTNVTTYRLKSQYNGSGHGLMSGAGINHERSSKIVHNNPNMIIDRASGNSGCHITFQNDKYYNGVLTLNNPVFDAGITKGCLMVMIRDTYANKPQMQKTLPTIYQNGVKLIGLDSKISGNTTHANPAYNFVRYH